MFRSIFLLGVFVLTLTSNAFGFRSMSDDGEMRFNSLTNDNPTLFDPRTHGAVLPRLSGRLDKVTLSNNGKAVNWQAITAPSGTLSMWGRSAMALPKQLEFNQLDQALKKFVDENSQVFGVKSRDLKNDRNRTKYSGPFKYITYQRYFRIEEAPFLVQGAFITFRFKNNRLIQITNNSFGDIGIVEAPVTGGDEALQSVMEDAKYDDAKDQISKMSAELQPFYGVDGRVHFRLVYQVSVRKSFPKGTFDYSVSALDGQVVRIMNSLHTAQVFGEVFPRLHGETLKRVPMPQIGIISGSEKGFADEAGSFEGENVTVQMAGARASVMVNGRQAVSQTQNKDGDILFSAANSLSENMAYVHINRVNAFVRQFVKTPSMDPAAPEKNFLDQPISVSTHTLNGMVKGCNAWFEHGSRSLNFLSEDDKCFDSAQFADIVYHEWGHALDNAFGGIQDGAFSEGIGDFTAMLMTGDSKIGPGFIKAKGMQPIRDISGFRHYPEGRDSNPHIESLIISGAWYDFYKLMVDHYGEQPARMKTAELFFKHLVSTDSYLDSYHGAVIVDDDDSNLENCTPHMCLMNLAFAKHGLVAADPRCSGGVEVAGGQACAPSTIFPN